MFYLKGAMVLYLLKTYFLNKNFIISNLCFIYMEINKSLKKRIKEVNLTTKGSNKTELKKQILDLLLIFDRTDKTYLEEKVINEIKRLKSKILIEEIKIKLKEASEKERKLNNIDDFKDLCNLMKYNQFDEALRKFYEKNK